MYIVDTKNVDGLLSLTASEEVATFEVEKLQDPLGSKRWRSTGLTPFLVGQFASSVTIDFWGLWYHNAQGENKARLRLANSQAALTAAPLYDSSLVILWTTGDEDAIQRWGYGHQRATIPVGSQVAATWFRIDFDFTGNPDGYVQCGALFLDAKFQPGFGHVTGWRYLPQVRGRHAVTYAAGGEGRGGGTYKRGIAIRFAGLTEAETWDDLETRLRDRVEVGPVGVVLEANDTRPMPFLIYGYAQVQSISSFHNRHEAELEIVEP